jgi:hypothetical protein
MRNLRRLFTSYFEGVTVDPRLWTWETIVKNQVTDEVIPIYELEREIPPSNELLQIFRPDNNLVQAISQFKLVEQLIDSGLVIPNGIALDEGCGQGYFAAVNEEYLKPHMLDVQGNNPIQYILGVDLDGDKIHRAKENLPQFKTIYPDLDFRIADPHSIAFLTGTDMSGNLLQIDGEDYEWDQEISLAWFGSVLHWLDDQKQYDTLTEVHSKSAKNAVLAMTYAAPGTGGPIVDAFRQEMESRGEIHYEGNLGGPVGGRYDGNPVGVKNRGELVSLLERSGWAVVSDETIVSNIFWEDFNDYVKAVETYGADSIEAPMGVHMDEAEINRGTLWNNLRSRTRKNLINWLDIVPENEVSFKPIRYALSNLKNKIRGKGTWPKLEGNQWIYGMPDHYLIAVKKEKNRLQDVFGMGLSVGKSKTGPEELINYVNPDFTGNLVSSVESDYGESYFTIADIDMIVDRMTAVAQEHQGNVNTRLYSKRELNTKANQPNRFTYKFEVELTEIDGSVEYADIFSNSDKIIMTAKGVNPIKNGNGNKFIFEIPVFEERNYHRI